MFIEVEVVLYVALLASFICGLFLVSKYLFCHPQKKAHFMDMFINTRRFGLDAGLCWSFLTATRVPIWKSASGRAVAISGETV